MGPLLPRCEWDRRLEYMYRRALVMNRALSYESTRH